MVLAVRIFVFAGLVVGARSRVGGCGVLFEEFLEWPMSPSGV